MSSMVQKKESPEFKWTSWGMRNLHKFNYAKASAILERTFKVGNTLPTKKELNSNDLKNNAFLRVLYTKYSWSILSHEFITSVAKFTKEFDEVYEVGCGAGWLSYYVMRYGGLITTSVTTDSITYPFKHLHFVLFGDGVDFIKSLNEEPNRKSKRLFIMSWPPMSGFAYKVWRELQPGDTLLYIGEFAGGCTANAAFFAAVDGHNDCRALKDVRTELDNSFVRFMAIHDYPEIYVK